MKNEIIAVTRANLTYTLNYFKTHEKFIYLMGIHHIPRSNIEKNDKIPQTDHYLLYQLLAPTQQKTLQVICPVASNEEKSFPSVSKMWSNALWFEKEVSSVSPLRFKNQNWDHQLFSGKTHSEFQQVTPPSETPVYYRDYKIKKIPWIHLEPGTKNNPLNWDLYIRKKSSKAHESFIQIGRTRKNIENLTGTKSEEKILEDFPYFKRFDYLFLIYHTLEKYNEIEVPDKAKSLRMILLEISRIIQNVVALRNTMGTARLKEMHQLFNSLELYLTTKIMSVLSEEKPLLCLSGIEVDTYILFQTLVETLHTLSKKIDRFEELFLKIPWWKKRFTKKKITKANVLKWSITGPIARATGLNIDARKQFPFYFYSDVLFDSPIGIKQSLFDLILIRFEDIRQSMRIIHQLIENLPVGNISLPAWSKKSIFSSQVLEKLPLLASSCLLERTNGMGTVHLLKKKDNNGFQEIKIISPDFNNTQFLSEYLKDIPIKDIPLYFASFNPIVMEVDR
ncbi:MAG: NADH-quinone oxidoreductase subunit C [Halobacteriovoraceae bacterium]|nr:NADH-quinone oxidoreductase subunit C [Halobacteriovoraceae bacterium]MCB9095425.1 NADH-quinone oxidoreductase subunit C [Halobacteriovoraceae bacterium]